MPLNVESLSNHAKTLLVASLASEVTVCARDTYDVGTDQVVRPELLRAYNELLHRVTGAVRDHLVGRAGYSLKDILEMLRRKEWKGWRNAMGFGTSDQNRSKGCLVTNLSDNPVNRDLARTLQSVKKKR